MGGAARIGGVLLLSLWGLGCSRDRVHLGGFGAGGSTSSVSSPGPGGAPASPAPPRRPPDSSTTPLLVPGALVPPKPAPFASLTVREQLTPPIAGGTLAVLADGSRAVASDPDRDAVHIVDLASGERRSVQLPAGSEPGRVVLDPSGQAHVVLRSAGQLARIEWTSARSQLSEPLCDHPRGLAFDAAADALLLACADGALLTLDPRNYTVRTRVALPRDLRDVVLGADGERFVSRFRSAQLLHLSAQDELLDQDLPAQLPRPVMTYRQGASVALVNTSATLAYRSVSAPNAELWMVHQRAQDDELEENSAYTGTLGCGPITQPSLTRFDARGHPRDSVQVHLPASLAVDLAVSGDGEWLALATPGAFVKGKASARLQRTEIMTKLGSIGKDGTATQELPDVQRTFCSPPVMIDLAGDAQATAVAFDAENRLYVQNRVPARLDVLRTSYDAVHDFGSAKLERSIVLAVGEVRDLGHEVFHGDAGVAGISCASCHGEGQDDGHTWRFKGLGARRSASLRGGILDTLPLHWSGEFANLEALVFDLWSKRMGGDALQAPIRPVGEWLQKLPALRLQPSAPDAAMRGEQLFESTALGCVTCHSGALLTNNQTMDVGTGAAFQVPSLRGLALRDPYMHDGCARELRALTDPRCGGAVHQSRLAPLSASQWQDLVAYLDSL